MLRSGNTWSDHEEAKLTRAYSLFINKVALIHNRSVNAILYRLENFSHPVKVMKPTTRDIGVGTD